MAKEALHVPYERPGILECQYRPLRTISHVELLVSQCVYEPERHAFVAHNLQDSGCGRPEFLVVVRQALGKESSSSSSEIARRCIAS